MKKLRFLFMMLLLLLGSQATWAITDLEVVTDSRGITYQIFEYSQNALNKFATIIHIQSSAYPLEIPDKVTMSDGQREATILSLRFQHVGYAGDEAGRTRRVQ